MIDSDMPSKAATEYPGYPAGVKQRIDAVFPNKLCDTHRVRASDCLGRAQSHRNSGQNAPRQRRVRDTAVSQTVKQTAPSDL